MSPASPLAAQLTRLPVRLAGSGDGHQRERIAASCAAVKIGRGLTIAARRAAMKARIHRTRSAQAAKREARSALYPHGRGGMTGGTYHYVVIEPAVFSGTYAETSTPTSDSHLPSLASAGLRWPPPRRSNILISATQCPLSSTGIRWLPDSSGRRYPVVTRLGGATREKLMGL